MKNSLYIGNLFGVKLYIHWTFALLLGWIVTSSLHERQTLGEFMIIMAFVVVVFICIVLHELGHAIAAKHFRIATSNITLLPIGGIAQFESLPEKPKEELLISIAGPAVNIGIAVILLPFANFAVLAAANSTLTLNASNFATSLVLLNIWLAVFNLVPAFPMDGGRVLRALLALKLDYVRATKIAAGLGQVLGLLFVFSGILFSLNLLFIGVMVLIAGRYESAIVQIASILHGYVVADVMMKEIPALQANLTLKQAGDALLTTQNKNFVVFDGTKPVGTISADEILLAMRRSGDGTLIDHVKKENIRDVSPHMSLEAAWKMMRQLKMPLIIVGDQNDAEGVLEEENIAEFVAIHSISSKR